ncbi:MAG: hypothetical protein ACI8V5_002411, partial [Limisphaerales bacterium]
MSAEILRQTLLELPADGMSGFEELVKRLLELLLDEPFVLAQSGSQPSGDAHDLNRRVCVQTKRYKNTPLARKNIEGDFDECIRTLLEVDIYLLAVTRSVAQLDDTLEAMRAKSSVDVVAWDFVDDESALAVLCIEYWSELQKFAPLQEADGKLGQWIQESRDTEAHRRRLNLIRLGLTACTQTRKRIRRECKLYLQRRFGIATDGDTHLLQPILLKGAVDRPTYCDRTLGWWRSSGSQILSFCGPEGHGKTWIAAQSALMLANDEGAIVLWLDSSQWSQCRTIEEALHEAIACLKIGDSKSDSRLIRKLCERWSRSVVLVLDGVNEHGALINAQQIVLNRASKHKGHCRLIFTSRPLDSRREYESQTWRHAQEIKVEPFGGDEFEAAAFKAGISVSDIPQRLHSIASIPRYFTTCLRLREQLQRFDNISVTTVLWAVLMDKIESTEPAIRTRLGFTHATGAIEIIAKLAIELPDANKSGRAQDLLNKCFDGKYAEARSYLCEIRIMEHADVFNARMNPHHLILGRALFIRKLIRSAPDDDVVETADRIVKELEPLVGEDGSAESIFVALQLTSLDLEERGETQAKERASLLYSWLRIHNSNVTDERLDFWCNNDFDAYALFVEAHFERLHPGMKEDFIVQRLVRLWLAEGEALVSLRRHMTRWLLFVWNEDCSGETLDYCGHTLPIAKTQVQVRLASVVVSLLSLRPESDFLRHLSLSLATDRLSWRLIESRQSRFKHINEVVGVLMRWRYTEKIIEKLEFDVVAISDDPVLLEGYQRLAATLSTDDLPDSLKLQPRQTPVPYFGDPAVKLLRKRCRVFRGDRVKPYPNETDFGYLAVREDLPNLLDDDVQVICRSIEKLSEHDGLHSGVSRRVEDYEMEAIWPWFAKIRPTKFAEEAGRLLMSAMNRNEHSEILSMCWFLQGVFPKLEADDLREWQSR